MINKQVLFCFVMSIGSRAGHAAALLSAERVQEIVCAREHITSEQFNGFLSEERDEIINKLVKHILLDPIRDHGIVYDHSGRANSMMSKYIQETFFRVVASPTYWTWALAPLVARGAQLEAEYCRGTVALEHARLNGDWENVAFTKELGVNGVEYCQGRTALMHAAYLGNGEKVAALLALGAHIEAVDREQYTALTTAACHDYSEVVKLLVAAMANIEAVDLYKRSAFKWAVYRGNEESVRVLIDGYRQQLAREKLTINGCVTKEINISPQVLVDRFLVNCQSGEMTPIEHQVRRAFEAVLGQVRECIWRYLSDEDIIHLGATKCGLLMHYAIEEMGARFPQVKVQKFTQFIQQEVEELNKYHVSFPMVWSGSNRTPEMVPRSEALKQLLQDALLRGYLVAPSVTCLGADGAQVTPMQIQDLAPMHTQDSAPMHIQDLALDGSCAVPMRTHQSALMLSCAVPMQIENAALCPVREAPWVGDEVAMELEYDADGNCYDVCGEPAPKRVCRR